MKCRLNESALLRVVRTNLEDQHRIVRIHLTRLSSFVLQSIQNIIKMVAITNEEQSKLFDVDSNRFKTTLRMTSEEEEPSDTNVYCASLCFDESFLAVSASNESTTLRLSHINKNTPRLSTRGILALMDHCDNIRELSLSYSLLSDELLEALSRSETFSLETLRIETHPETKSTSNISSEAWHAFADRFPEANVVLLNYLTEARDCESLLASHIPLTHLYFGESAPSSAVMRVGERCPKLVELVIGASGPETIDQALTAVATGCPRLNAVGLGDCELTCSGFVKFVSLCRERLKILYVMDTSLLEDDKYNISEVAVKVSSLLGKSWQPNYVPYW